MFQVFGHFNSKLHPVFYVKHFYDHESFISTTEKNAKVSLPITDGKNINVQDNILESTVGENKRVVNCCVYIQFVLPWSLGRWDEVFASFRKSDRLNIQKTNYSPKFTDYIYLIKYQQFVRDSKKQKENAHGN